MSDVLLILLTFACFALAVGAGRLLDRAVARDAAASSTSRDAR